MKYILYRVYSIYAVVLLFSMIPLILFYYLMVIGFEDRKRTLLMYKGNRTMLKIWFVLTGFSMSVEGMDLIDADKTYVFVGNHVNMLDVPMAGYALMHYFKPIAKKETRDLFLIGFLFRILAIPVDRESAINRREVYEQMADSLKNGISIALLPEGTRNRTDYPLMPFKSGAFRAAIEAQVPIAPMVFLDIRPLQPNVDGWWAIPGKMRFKMLPPISTENLTQDDADALKYKVFHQILTVLLQEDNVWKDWKGNREDLVIDFPKN